MRVSYRLSHNPRQYVDFLLFFSSTLYIFPIEKTIFRLFFSLIAAHDQNVIEMFLFLERVKGVRPTSFDLERPRNGGKITAKPGGGIDRPDE